MKAFGASRAATQHYRKGRKQAAGGQEEGDEPQKYRLEEGDGTTHAQRIVRELYLRYEKQLQRWKDYRNLFVFLAFVTLFLAVLYLQRNADVAYKVHSTIESVVVPENDVMQNTDEVYDWLDGLLTEVWKDPVCGDGLCEAPFEFASYSRFGCRADCGKLSEVQNLTKIQVDIYYDFSHPVGSIPASDLMQQASWNLCPVQTPYSTDCYYDSDMTFDRLSGTQNYYIDDAPDGQWNLVVKRDIFNKVKGAVRDTVLVTVSGYFYKIYIAAAAALGEQEFEINLLQQAVNISGTEFWTYADSTIRAGYPNTTEYAAAKDWIRDATCYCGGVNFNDTFKFENSSMMLYLNQSVSRTDRNQPFSLTYDEYQKDTYYCLDRSNIIPKQWKGYNDTNGTWYKQLDPINMLNSTAVSEWCSGGLNLSLTWRANMTGTVQRLVIDRRLGDQRTTGKIAVRNTVNTNLRNFLIANNPELIGPIYNSPSGTVAKADPISARIDYLMDLYVKSDKYSQQYASYNITRSVVYDSGVHLLQLIPRIQSRVDEVNNQIADVRGINLPAPLESYGNGNVEYTFQNTTVGTLYYSFTNASATNSTLPTPYNDTLGAFKVVYDLSRWDGNTTAYMRCDLEDRGKDYVGQCVAMNNTCIATTNDTVPYNCTDLSNNNATIPGSLRNSSYRTLCEMPCDRRFDCNTLCECFGTCKSTEYCECNACTRLSVSATDDDQFISIRSVVTDQASASAMIASVNMNSPSVRRLARRRLQANATDEEIAAQLSNVLTNVGTVSEQQKIIASQMTELQKQVDKANAIAEARAKDQTVLNAIKAGREEIAQGQARVEAKLDEIIGKQTQALAAAQTAITAINAIKSLAERQIDAQQQLEARVVEQLGAITIATRRDVITLTQAFALWKRARRDRALTLKAAQLANMPCNSNTTESHTFSLDNNNTVDVTTSRERNVGLTNRVIAGLLLHQTRTNETECPSSKFDKIQKTCTGPLTISSYGVDPVFKRGTELYDPDFDDVAGRKVISFYDCDELKKHNMTPTYGRVYMNQTVNQEPYCAELYNPQGLPYAFHFFPLKEKEDGFPVYFDINLSEDGAQSWFTYIKEGLYLDQNTRTMTAELVTYNAQLRIFSYFYIRFFFSDGGSIKITHRLNTVRVELYDTYSNRVRFGFEIILCMWIFAMLLYNLFEIGYTQVKQGNFLKYFLSGWHWVEFASNGLLTACMIIWWIFKEEYAKTFNIFIRYDVYASLAPDANFLALNENGDYLLDINNAFADLRELVDMLNWYFALNGINILLLIARVLKLMDFQPRLGVVTRSLWLAGPDLIHFAIVAGMVFVGYAMMAHLIFGNAIESFATFGDSINTCFEILLGNIDVNNELRALGGLQSVAGALFFWSYELLVFMVLLNFLLAIIVDAFSEVKEKTHETVGIHTELFTLLRDKWRSLLGRFSPNYISDAKLGELLRQWAGEDDDDKNDDGGDVDKRKLLTILNEDMDEETLREVFKECLRDAPDNTDKAKAAASAGLFSRFLHGGHSRNRMAVSEEDILQAAHYIVERFGTVPEDDGDEDFDGDGGMDAAAQLPAGPNAGGPGGSGTGSLSAGNREAVLEKERDQLAQALERLAEVQRELAEGQRNLMNGQKQLAEQQSKLVQLMNEQPPTGN